MINFQSINKLENLKKKNAFVFVDLNFWPLMKTKKSEK